MYIYISNPVSFTRFVVIRSSLEVPMNQLSRESLVLVSTANPVALPPLSLFSPPCCFSSPCSCKLFTFYYLHTLRCRSTSPLAELCALALPLLCFLLLPRRSPLDPAPTSGWLSPMSTVQWMPRSGRHRLLSLAELTAQLSIPRQF